jgi:hypothetical protein
MELLYKTTNIVSVGQLDEAGHDIHIKSGKMDIRKSDLCLLARIRRKQNRLYMLDVNFAWRAACLTTWAEAKAEAKCWHAWLGHVNMHVLRRMVNQEVVLGLPSIEQVEGVCEACMSFLSRTHRRTIYHCIKKKKMGIRSPLQH